MRVPAIFDNPQVRSWASGYQKWGPSTSEDSHLEEDNGQHHSNLAALGHSHIWDLTVQYKY